MVGRMSKQYLKDIIKQLHFYGRGGTNAALAAEIVAMLTYKAQEGDNLKREYSVVKGVYANVLWLRGRVWFGFWRQFQWRG